MAKNIKVGILKETKNPPDRRVAVTPKLAVELLDKFKNVELYIQPSDLRCFEDSEYEKRGINLREDLSICDILIGVKEVKIPTLIDNKTYLFFAHVAKKQPYNRELLQAILKRNIKLADYEYLTTEDGLRVVAFGRWAGMVGAYNGLRALGLKFGRFDLKPAHEYVDKDEMFSHLSELELLPRKFLITGGGRVAGGAMETLNAVGMQKVSPEDFLNKDFEEAVYCQIDPDWYVKRKDGAEFDLQHFFKNPEMYDSTFKKFTKVTDVFIPCHFWDPKSPVFMTKEDMRESDFRIKVIADVSCDIAIPIPSTLRASTIANPFYDYNPVTEKEQPQFSSTKNISVMAVDNLPGELPRDASIDFGSALMKTVFPYLFGDDTRGIVERATITENGKLTKKYDYLQAYVDGKE